MPCFVVFVDFHGVNTFTRASFKLSTGSQNRKSIFAYCELIGTNTVQSCIIPILQMRKLLRTKRNENVNY